MAEEAIDRMKTEAGDVPLIAVGGGAFLIPEKLPGVSQVIHVEHGDCANAVGAAIMIVIYPIVVITKTVLYYDTRIRREGFDVEWMAAGGAGGRCSSARRSARGARRSSRTCATGGRSWRRCRCRTPTR